MPIKNHHRSLPAATVALATQLLLFGPAASAQNATVLPVVTTKLSLVDALHLADANNVALAQTKAASLAAQADADAATAAIKPTLSAITYATTGNESSIITSAPGVSPQNIFAVPTGPFGDQDLMLMIPLSTGGSLRHGASAASSKADAAQADISASRLSTHLAVVEAYARVLFQNALIDSAASRTVAEQEQVRITQDKVNTGRLAPVDLLREQAELADAQSGLTQAKVNAELALIDLKTDLGVSQTSDITLTDTLDTLALAKQARIPATLADAIHLAVKSRPEIAAASERVQAASAQVSAARGASSPQVYAVGMADAMVGQEGRGQTGYTVGLAASLPLYDGGARKAEVDHAAASLNQAQADARQAEQTVESDVAQAWYALQAAHDDLTSATAGLTAARQGYDLANLRYNAGKSTTAERLDALAAQTRAQGLLDQTEANVIMEKARLSAALNLTP